MKICYVTYGRGGIATYAYNIGNALAALGHEVHIVCFDNPTIVSQALASRIHYHAGRLNWLAQRVLNNSWRVEQLSGRAIDISLRAHLVSQVVMQLNQIHKFDIIEAPEARALLLPLQNKKIPVAIKMHGPTEITASFQTRRITRGIIRQITAFERRTIDKAELVQSCSRALAQRIVAQWGISKPVHVVYNPIDTDSFTGNLTTQRKPEVLFVGRLEQCKGFDVLIRTIPQVLAELPDAHFTIIGDDTNDAPGGGSFWKWAQNQLQHLGRSISFLGPLQRDELIKYYREASVTVVPSRWETLPYTAMEAMACGSIAVGSAVGGIPEVIGSSGILVPPDDPAACAEAIISLLSDGHLRQKLQSAARKNVVEKFSPCAIAAKVESLFESALN